MELKGNHYMIQGNELTQLAHEYDTPVYVYDASQIIHQLNQLRLAFSSTPTKIKYAIKALSNLSILRLLNQHGIGADAVSINEGKLGLMAGFAPENIVFTPSGVDLSEISEAVLLGLQINLDSLSILKQFGEKYGKTVPCIIRLNPHIMAGRHSKIATGHILAKFGISITQLPDIKQIVSTYDIQVIGLHIHTGSEIDDVEVYLKTGKILYEMAPHFPKLKYLDFGGGFKVSYHKDDLTPDIAQIGKSICKSFEIFSQSYGRPLELWIEPGKYLVSQAGYLLVKTTLVKTTPATTFVGINSGFNHLARPMMYNAWHDMVNISNPHGALKTYTIVGNICETDTFGHDRTLCETREGDFLVIKNVGAYGYSMSSQYNSRFRPAEVLIENGTVRLIRRRDTWEDLVHGQLNN